MLVDEAVFISTLLGISKVLIGVIISSLGTTVPEATVSGYDGDSDHLLAGHSLFRIGFPKAF